MKLSMEIPSLLLPKLSPLCDIDFILAQFVLSDPAYAEFYKRSTRHKLMDNGFHERGEPMTVAEMVKAAELCKPDVVIAPDWLDEPAKTFEGLMLAKRRFPGGTKLATVLQGRDRSERLAFWSAVRPIVDTVCLPFKRDRFAWFNELVGSTNTTTKWPPRLHLLGMKSLEETKHFAVAFEDLRMTDRCSIDTGKMVKLGLANETFHEGMDLRGKGLLDHSISTCTPEQLANILYNVAYARKYM